MGYLSCVAASNLSPQGSRQRQTNSPASQNIPPVQKIPAKIEVPPLWFSPDFLCLDVTQAFLPVLPAAWKEDQAGMPESLRIAGLSGSGMDFDSWRMHSPSIAQD
jgi:hypothetical protein